jgi:CRISPR/Cas system-associated endonuclease/helicase Cas3
MLDADDFYHPDKLKIQVDYFEKNPSISLLSSGMASYKNLEEDVIRARGNKHIECRNYTIGDKVEFVHAPSMLILKEAKKISYNVNFKYSQDMEFLDRYLNGKNYASINKVLYYYSEFDSVSKSKVIKTYFYVLRKIRNSPLKLFKKVKEYLKIIGKLCIYLLLFPFVSADFFLKKRGSDVTLEMKQEYRKTVQQLLK